ncbi:hypothetical protein [Kribbella deserti]|uniref:Topoisomerase n=1 Tax=Kribbella deserti TaxID=1926257 RepID=A0ABV6QE13_9ACTN
MTEREPLRPLTTSQQHHLNQAVERYQAALTPQALSYLTEQRGLTEETIRTARLGVVATPDPLHARFTGWLAIPYLDRHGQPLTIRFRCLDDRKHSCKKLDHGKYMSLPEDPTRLYGIGAIHTAGDEIHLTEGEIDRLTLTQIGLPAIGGPGADSWTSHHRRMLAGFSRIWVWADPDPAGARFLRTVTKFLHNAVPVPLRHDVNATYVAAGADALLALIAPEIT